MHKPTWRYSIIEFVQIEEMLQSRNYTMFAGHEHYYNYTHRFDRDYIDMAATGGTWLRDGPCRVDHIAWVTITDAGPRIANIELKGQHDLHILFE